MLGGARWGAEGRGGRRGRLRRTGGGGVGREGKGGGTQLDSLRAVVGSGGVHLAETDDLTVRDVASDGTVDIRAGQAGSVLAIESLVAAGQRGVLGSGGTIVDGDSSGSDDEDIVAGSLELLAAAGVGTTASRIETNIDELRSNTGTGGLCRLITTDRADEQRGVDRRGRRLRIKKKQ